MKNQNIMSTTIILFAFGAFGVSAMAQAPAGALWYNGDLNENAYIQWNNAFFWDWGNYVFKSGHIYDDFIVSSPHGWQVTSVYSDHVTSEDTYSEPFDLGGGATWEIRQGMSEGNPGTLVAYGISYAPVVTPTGRFSGGFAPEYQVLVDGLDVTLVPGTYWLNVSPIGVSTITGPPGGTASPTNGANCVGSPCGNDANSFIYDGRSGYVWHATGEDFSMGVNGLSCPFNCSIVFLGAISIKLAGSISEGIPLPLTGESGVEDRSGRPGGNYTVAMTFTEDIISIDHASSSCGKVASTSINGNVLTINLTGVSNACNATNITITANDVKDDAGNNLATASVTMGLLLGDVNGNRTVDANDVGIVQSELGQQTNDTNFRSDVNNDGIIDQADLTIVNRQLGTVLPP